ncbi:MAG: deoxyribodipyrimidine photo-lyase [Actinomycetota bacterium]
MTAVLWFRRDLRLADHPALAEAGASRPGGVVGLFVVDDRLWGPSGDNRRAWLARTLAALDEQAGGRLVVRHGRPEQVVPALVREVEAEAVYVSADFGPYGRGRDGAVAEALGPVPLVGSGSPYAVDPGEVRAARGEPYRVFTPFHRGWTAHGWGVPVEVPPVTWVGGVASAGRPGAPDVKAALPPAGEAAAHRRLDAFMADVDRYGTLRDRPDLDRTSRLSPYLRWGTLHPRQVLAQLGEGPGAAKFRAELAWREFYADVLWHRPESARRALQPAMAAMEVDTGPEADRRFEAWATGQTGYPYIDAGMRQLLGEGWVHNRVRMAVASFLVKDLHLDWRRGARWFMRHLVDGDLASNQHGWQWVAGTGTDPAPYFRVFNPVTQGQRHDPHGDYVRRWVPELAGVAGAAVHEPWKLGGLLAPAGYPPPIIDHGQERADALARYQAARSTSAGRAHR